MNHNLAIDTAGGLVKFGLNNPLDDVFFWDLCRSRQVIPERELILAVLEQAIEYATMSNREDYREEAREWIADTSNWYLFSFVRCCEVLGLDPAAVRKAIEARYR